jgi:hypothetical protein
VLLMPSKRLFLYVSSHSLGCRPRFSFIHTEPSRRYFVFGVLVIQHHIMAPLSSVRRLDKRGMRNVGFI